MESRFESYYVIGNRSSYYWTSDKVNLWFGLPNAMSNGFCQSSGLIDCRSSTSCCIAENFLPVKWKSLALCCKFYFPSGCNDCITVSIATWGICLMAEGSSIE
ncbi:hypothetical protein NC653_013219 [Populus alba x Populus x berolinensis]|uniref:Uncharacterized protein n=1 Tax=Populus alba x Populus x berolinensis TaxID=444605 RepID=A0AAD6QU28_9ROSI|nr:hypothetical protein NC653_013219 [Populus alba x Populus x berolinensis]